MLVLVSQIYLFLSLSSSLKMYPNKMRLSIIIVNYKSISYILDCLASAESTLINDPAIEWIVVDNEDSSECKESISLKFPFVTVIQMGYNAGFARANNAGIKMARGENILLLNPDTILIPGSIQTCLSRFENSNHIACGVQLVYPNHEPQFSGSRFVKGGMNHLLELPYWGSAVKYVASFLKTNKPSIIKAEKEQRVDWVSGAFLMAKRSAVDKAGLLDEDFFLYAEEVEWCSRLSKQGTICIYGDIEIIHLIGTSIQSVTESIDNSYTNLSDKKGFQLMVSNHVRIRKQYGIFWFFCLLLNYTWAIPFAFIACFFTQLLSFKNILPEFKYLLGFTKNVFKLWAMVPIILSGKPHFYKCI
jgi:GT2 family glycosyltransferase